MRPMKRASRFFEAGVEPATGEVVVMECDPETPDCTTPYTSGWDEMFPDAASELSRGVRLTDSREKTRRVRFLLPALVAATAMAMVSARTASAQSDSPVGVRAAGMAGAFPAVADDA